MASGKISLENKILDYQNDADVVAFINSSACTKEMVNELGGNNMTPLHVAAMSNKYTIVEALINKGADVNGLFYGVPTSGLPPLHMAIYYGSYDNADKDNNLKTINLLLAAKADINIPNHSAFVLACIKSKNEVIKILLNYDIDIQFKGAFQSAYDNDKTGLDYLKLHKNEIGIKIVEAHMLSKALQEELTVTKSKNSKKVKV